MAKPPPGATYCFNRVLWLIFFLVVMLYDCGLSLVMGIFAIGIYRSFIIHTFGQETEVYFGRAGIFIGHTAYIPVLGMLVAACNGDVIARFCLKVTAVAPVNRHIFDELECVGESLVILGQVAGHLQRARHCEVQCQLAGKCGQCLSVLPSL